MDPACIQIQEVEYQVSDVRRTQHEHVVRHEQQEQIEAQIRQHRVRRRAVLVHLRQIPGQPSIHRRLIERPRRPCHGSHDRENNRENQHDDQYRADQLTGVDHPGHHPGHTHAAVDIRGQHAGVGRGANDRTVSIEHRGFHQLAQAEKALEGERHERIDQHAQQAGVEDRLERIGLGVLEFPRVAHRRFEAVRGPGREEHAAGNQSPAGAIPGPIHYIAARVVSDGREREEMRLDHVTRQYRHHADQDQRDHGRDPQDLGGVGRTQNPAVLNGLHGQHD